MQTVIPPDEVGQAKFLLTRIDDFAWRMNNLYKIKDAQGNAVPFRPNWAQIDLLENMGCFNVILKARQLGFTTLIAIYFLDWALFHPNNSCAIIAQGLNEAGDIFDNKVKFAYDNLPDWVKADYPLLTCNTSEIEFANGSKIVVGLSLRSGTYQKLHVSEYGKVSIKFPEKAREIKTGAFNTVAAGQQIFVESTAEGKAGEFFDLVKRARDLADAAKHLTPLDPKFFFYPWWKNPAYEFNFKDTVETPINEELAKYFQDLDAPENGNIRLTNGQKAWYTKKSAQMDDDMMREFPSTPDEAFNAGIEGAIYARQMRLLRKAKMIGRIPWEPAIPVHVFWDFGAANYMALWFFQQVGREWHMIRYYQSAGSDFDEYAKFMRDLPYSYGSNYVPHDGATTRLQATGGNKTYKQMMETAGIKNIKIVPRTNSKWKDILFICKPALLKCWIDEENCAAGIKCLDNYRKVMNKDGVWLDEPLHDEYSDGADAFRTFAVGYKEMVKTDPVSFRLGAGQRSL